MQVSLLPGSKVLSSALYYSKTLSHVYSFASTKQAWEVKCNRYFLHFTKATEAQGDLLAPKVTQLLSAEPGLELLCSCATSVLQLCGLSSSYATVNSSYLIGLVVRIHGLI